MNDKWRLTHTHRTAHAGAWSLRAVGAESSSANEAMDLYRGMRNVDVPNEFLEKGGTELAPMSTTSDLTIALK